MAEKVTLKLMKCPTCGAPLKAENNTDSITCVYCGNTIVPVSETSVAPQADTAAGFGGSVKIEGMRTPSSALAYIEQVFEEYDWDAFAYAQTLSVVEIDRLANSLKAASADDKNTWFVCFKAVAVPFMNKVSGCQKILSSVIEEYKKDNLDAYSKFDAYKRIEAMISARKAGIIANLEKIVVKAAKYGASPMEVDGMNAEIDTIKNLERRDAYGKIEDIPEIRAFILERNEKIVAELAEEGINAGEEYARARALIKEKKFVEALNILLRLKGYAESKMLIEKLDKYFLISDVLEIEGILYYFKSDGPDSDTISLYPTSNGNISNKPIIKNISKMITNHADVLYYLDNKNMLRQYNLATGVGAKILDKVTIEKSVYVYGRKVYMVVNRNDHGGIKRDVVALDLTNGVVSGVWGNIKEIVALTGNKMIYTASQKNQSAEGAGSYKIATYVLNLDTMRSVEISTRRINIVGFADNYVVYTQEAPNKYNRKLFVKELKENEPEKLIEQNIFKFCDIIGNKLFYYIGNTKNQTLININLDGTERKEWPLYISEVLFEQGGWLYFIRKAGYNSVLCKSRLDGSRFSIIAADIDKFIEIKNGYLYYINDEATLVKVRMDGSNLQELCNDVETILSVQEDKIVFISVDDRIVLNAFDQTTVKRVKSIYAVDFSGSGKIKLVYDIKTAKEYDENTVYYTAALQSSPSNDQEEQWDMLYRLNTKTNCVERLLYILVGQKVKSSIGAFAKVVMFISFLMALIGFANEETAIGVLGLLMGAVTLLIGFVHKYSKET